MSQAASHDARPRFLPARVWRHLLWRNLQFFLWFAVPFWAISLFAVFMESQGMQYASRRGNNVPSWFLLGIAIMVSCLTLTRCAILIRRAAILAQRGIPMSATIRRLGGLVDVPSLRTYLVSYMVDGRAYTPKIMPEEGGFAVGEKVQLLIDPLKPGRAMFRNGVFPDDFDPSSTEGLQMPRAD